MATNIATVDQLLATNTEQAAELKRLKRRVSDLEKCLLAQREAIEDSLEDLAEVPDQDVTEPNVTSEDESVWPRGFAGRTCCRVYNRLLQLDRQQNRGLAWHHELEAERLGSEHDLYVGHQYRRYLEIGTKEWSIRVLPDHKIERIGPAPEVDLRDCWFAKDYVKRVAAAIADSGADDATNGRR